VHDAHTESGQNRHDGVLRTRAKGDNAHVFVYLYSDANGASNQLDCVASSTTTVDILPLLNTNGACIPMPQTTQNGSGFYKLSVSDNGLEQLGLSCTDGCTQCAMDMDQSINGKHLHLGDCLALASRDDGVINSARVMTDMCAGVRDPADSAAPVGDFTSGVHLNRRSEPGFIKDATQPLQLWMQHYTTHP
jgi:hypothetical protein